MRRVAWLLLALVLPACAPGRIEITPLAEGEWMVVDATSSRAVLLQMRSATQPASRGEDRDQTPTIRLLGDSLEEPASAETTSVPVGRSTIQLARVTDGQHESYVSTRGTPRIMRSPADLDLYAFEHDDAIWVWKTSGRTMSKLTADEGLDSLRAMQREGSVILYWTAGPVWSADGEFIAFMTNRHGVRANTRSQGIRVVHTGTGIEKDVFDSTGVSVHVDGVLGEQFVYSSSAAPGVFAVHPRTAVNRKIADGHVVGFHVRGRSVAIQDSDRVVLHGAERADTLPAPAAGFKYTSHAFYSPSGNRVAMFSTDERGGYALHMYDTSSRRGWQVPVPGGPSYGPVWASESAVILAAAHPSAPLITYRAALH